MTQPGIVDVDTHVIEPYDLWTSRVSKKRWGDLVPEVRWDPKSQMDMWYFGDRPIRAAASAAMAYHTSFAPEHPRTLSEAHPSTYDAKERLQVMDEYGIYAQVLYPNVAGFGAGNFTKVPDPELMLDLLRAYNDFLVEFCGADPDRFIPVMSVPFWDLDVAIGEIRRCVDIGHRGIVFGQEPEAFGAPRLDSPHWDPIWRTCAELDLSVNFHIASGDNSFGVSLQGPADRGRLAAVSVACFVGNTRAIGSIICSGIAHRFPSVKFVSVESGVGWIPFVLEALDWQWNNLAVRQDHPEYDLLPSEYFRRQFYGCFWFEEENIDDAIGAIGVDNLLYETDFPHATSMTPGPGSAAVAPPIYRAKALANVSEEDRSKILFENAAALYKIR